MTLWRCRFENSRMKFGGINVMLAKKKRFERIVKPQFINSFCAVRNSIVGMQCKAKTAAVHLYCEDFQRRNAPEYCIYGSTKWCPGRDSNPHEVTR
jgi:hypothetical protein